MRAGHCLMDEGIEFPGIEPVVGWVVHPQCLEDDTPTLRDAVPIQDSPIERCVDEHSQPG